MKDKFIKFMQGRYGVDEMSRFESFIIWIPLLLACFIRVGIVQTIFFVITIALIAHNYFRIFSKNISKRYAENQKFKNLRYTVVAKTGKLIKRLKDGKTYRFFKCPMCHQKVRVPRGHGKVSITCPKCREQFIRRT